MRCAPLEIVVPRGPATAYIHVNMHVSIAIPTRDKNSQHQARGNIYEGGGGQTRHRERGAEGREGGV